MFLYSSQRKEIAMDDSEYRQHISRLEAQIDILKAVIVDMKSESQPTIVGNTDAKQFTIKQHATMQMLHAGYTNLQIADVLGCQESTVKVHVKAIMDKLGVRTRSQVVLRTQSIMNMEQQEYQYVTGIPKDWYLSGGGEEVDHLIKNKTKER